MAKHLSKCIWVFFLALTSCSTQLFDIETICESVNDSCYIIKWEVWPETHGYVQIYASTDPKHFDKSNRVARCKISDKICDITLDKTPDTRYYFLLQFDKKNQRIVASPRPQHHKHLQPARPGRLRDKPPESRKVGISFPFGQHTRHRQPRHKENKQPRHRHTHRLFGFVAFPRT